MIAANYNDDFNKYSDIAINDSETVFITRKDGKTVVMMSEDEYNNMLENLYVRSDGQAYGRLLESVRRLKAGQGTKRELIDE